MVTNANGAADPAAAQQRLAETLKILVDSPDAATARAAARSALAQVEAADREAEIERRVAERLEAERRRQVEVPRRSAMSAASKSRFIREFGIATYKQLPWE